MNTDTAWRADWVIDPDPLAAAQARHLPTGLGFTLKTIKDIGPKDGHPFVAVVYSDDSRPLIRDRQHQEGHPPINQWIESYSKQALELWRELGFDLDRTSTPGEPLPCKIESWRAEWRFDTEPDESELPDLVHSSGLAVRYVYTEVDQDGRMGWCATMRDGLEEQLIATLGKAKVERLWREAAILRLELGYFDSSPTKFSPTFGKAWRTLWKVVETPGNQELEHVSCLRLKPCFGFVDEDLEGWYMHVPAELQGFDMHMRAEVGNDVWEAVHDQGFKLGIELGYIKPGEFKEHKTHRELH